MTSSENQHVMALWGAQTLDPSPITVEQVRISATKLTVAVRRRNRIEYAAALFGVLIFGSYLWIFPTPLLRLGSLLLIAAFLFVALWLRFRAATRPIPMHLTFMDYVARYREELQHQQSALRTVWLWYIAPFVPGALIFCIGLVRLIGPALGRRAVWGILAVNVTVLTGVFVGVWLLNSRAARHLQTRIDEMSLMLESCRSGAVPPAIVSSVVD